MQPIDDNISGSLQITGSFQVVSDLLLWVISISPPLQVRNVRDNTFRNMSLNESFMLLNGPE